MQASLVSFNLWVIAAAAASNANQWQAPTSSDSRAPCPMLNTLANHGYIQRDGKNIDLATMQAGFAAAINLAPDFVEEPFAAGLEISTTGNASTLNLHDLVKHNAIEHDVSISRKDFYFGDDLHFNDAVWAQVNSTWGNETVTLAQAADSRNRRLRTCMEENPDYNLTSAGNSAGIGETALFLTVFGDKETGNASRSWVEVFFQNERLPLAEGWVRPSAQTTSEDIANMTAKVEALSTTDYAVSK